MSETVRLPWIDEPVELAEAVELLARADEADEETIQEVTRRVGTLEDRVTSLEGGNEVECPSCGSEANVYKAGVGAAVLATKDALSDGNAEALDGESHVCLDCRKSFTPAVE